MLERLGFLLLGTGSNFCGTGHPIWGMSAFIVAALLLWDSGVLVFWELFRWKAVKDIRKFMRRL